MGWLMTKQIKALQYYRTDHFLEKINPLSKFSALISLSAFIFISGFIWQHVTVFIICTVLFFISPFRFIKYQGSRILLVTTLFIAILQVTFYDQGITLFTLSFLRITDIGLLKAVSASSRFISIILLSYLFVLSTDPGRFVAALVRLGIPYRYGYTLITALRMVPMVKSEVKKIHYAQLTRGSWYSLFPVKKTISNIGSFLKVVMISTIKRVNQLVISMEGRSFGLFPERTTLSSTNYRWIDYLITFISFMLIPISILWS